MCTSIDFLVAGQGAHPLKGGNSVHTKVSTTNPCFFPFAALWRLSFKWSMPYVGKLLCVCVCVRACVRACVRVCVSVSVSVCVRALSLIHI